MARKKLPRCSSHKSLRTKPIKPLSGNFQYPYTILERRNEREYWKENTRKCQKSPIDGTEPAVPSTDKKNHFGNKLVSTPRNFQRSPEKDFSPKKHTLRGPGGKCVSASEKAQKVEEGTICASKPQIRKEESDEDNSDFDCYNKSDGKPVHVNIDKEITEGGPALAWIPNKSEEETNNNDDTMGGIGSFNVRRSNGTFKPPDRLNSVPFFVKVAFCIYRTNPKRTTKTQTDDNGGDGLGRKLRSQWRQVTYRKRGKSRGKLP